MRGIRLTFGDVTIVRFYGEDNPIWNLPQEKRERQLVADVQRELSAEADRLAQIKIVERG